MQQVCCFQPLAYYVYFTSFHSVNGIFFTFPSQYLYTIDQLYVLAFWNGLQIFSQTFTWLNLLELFQTF